MRKHTLSPGINKKVLWVIIIIGLLLCVNYIPTLTTLISQAIANHNAPAAIKKAFENSSPIEDEEFKRIDDTLGSSTAVEQKIGATKASTCAIESVNGGGWVTAGYRQTCFLRYTAGYYTNYSKNDARSLLKDVFGSNISDSPAVDDMPDWCEMNGYGTSYIIRYVKANSIPSFDGAYKYLNYQPCGAPSKNQGLSSIGVNFESEPSFNVLKDIDIATIDTSRDQIWIEYEHTYYDENLGCAPGFSLFGCPGSPRTDPIQP